MNDTASEPDESVSEQVPNSPGETPSVPGGSLYSSRQVSIETSESRSRVLSKSSTSASMIRRGSSLRSRRSESRKSRGSFISKGSDPTPDGQSTKNPLDDISNKALLNAVQELQRNVKHYQLENMVFLHFLEKNDPTALEAMETTLKTAEVIQERSSIVSTKRQTLTRISRRSSAFIGFSTSFILPSLGDKEGPRINISQKTELVLREMDDIEEALEILSKKCHALRHKLAAQLEEMSIRENEILEIMKNFEDVFVNDIVEKYQQKDPGIKFARFMEDCFKQNRTTIDKLRLRTSSLKVQYQKLSNILTQKKLLGENLQEVDFEQLQISNKRMLQKIDQRNLLLLELKKINGAANFLLSRTKKILLKKEDSLKDIKDTIKFQENLIVKLDTECDKVAMELDAAKDEYYKLKEKSENFEVPPVLDYVRRKADLGVLKKNLKIWSRRKQLKDMALSACVREMKLVSGLKPLKQPTNTSIQTTSLQGSGKQKKLSFEFVYTHKSRSFFRKKGHDI